MNAQETLLPLGMMADYLELTLVDWFNLDLFDLLFVVTAIVFNIQVISIYIAGKNKRHDMVRVFGMVVLSLSFPFAIVFSSYLISGQEQWILLGFCIIFIYLLLELLFDFILKIEFRSKPLLHIPYIILFYVVEIAFISIAFSISVSAGYFVSISFWLLLAVLIYTFLPTRKLKSHFGDLT